MPACETLLCPLEVLEGTTSLFPCLVFCPLNVEQDENLAMLLQNEMFLAEVQREIGYIPGVRELHSSHSLISLLFTFFDVVEGFTLF